MLRKISALFGVIYSAQQYNVSCWLFFSPHAAKVMHHVLKREKSRPQQNQEHLHNLLVPLIIRIYQ